MSVEAMPADRFVGVFYVGVADGEPIVQKIGDHHGDCEQVEIFPKAEDALARFHNVRRVRVYLDPEPVRAPESWGAIEGGDDA